MSPSSLGRQLSGFGHSMMGSLLRLMIGRGVKSFELIVMPRLGENKQVQTEGCLVFGQSPYVVAVCKS